MKNNTTHKTLTPDDLRSVRAKLGVTQRGLAKMLATTNDTVASWEQGRRPINLISTFAILHLFCDQKPKRAPRPRRAARATAL